jgi:hypothetical protein
MALSLSPARSALCLAIAGTRDGRDLGALMFNDFAKFGGRVGASDQPAAS